MNLIEISCLCVEKDHIKTYGFVLKRGSATFEMYTKTKSTYAVWAELFRHFTIQFGRLSIIRVDFDKQFIIKDLYEKEQGMIYALCQRIKNKGKEYYMAKFIELETLGDDIDSVGGS